MIIVYILLLAAGFFGLIKGADIFVRGSSSLAKFFKVPSLIIGLTVVALGTSAPELAVSISASIQNSNEIALSNVIGSNIFNLLGVLGICAIISPLPVDKDVLKRDMPISIFSTLFLFVLTSIPLLSANHPLQYQSGDEVGTVSRIIGLIMILLFAGYISLLIIRARKKVTADPDEVPMSMRKSILFILFGLAFIIAGGQAVVYSAKNIARAAGMTETLIGLTIVAIGTSLPELVTSIVAARKGETELAIGNVIGSNIFNLLFILGVSAFIHPVTVNMASVYDMLILLFISVLSFVFCLTSKKITRSEGIIMILLYITDVLFAIFR